MHPKEKPPAFSKQRKLDPPASPRNDEPAAAYVQLPRLQQLELAEELVHTRASEVKRAWPQIVTLGVGLRQRRMDAAPGDALIDEICVVISVKRKWPKGAGHQHPDRLPSHFLIGVGTAPSRTLCAIPTDVIPAAPQKRFRPQNLLLPGEIRVDFDDARSSIGLIPARVSGPQLAASYALSCKHVLSGRKILHGVSGANIVDHREASLGTSSVFAGDMVPGRPAFDAQLCKVENLASLRHIIAARNFDAEPSQALSTADLPMQFFVLAPDQGAIACTFVRFWYADFQIDYPTNEGSVSVSHRILVEYRAAVPTQAGYSGAAVVSAPHGGSFLGMHIAGSNLRGLFIPAWQLANPELYGSGGERLRFLGRDD